MKVILAVHQKYVRVPGKLARVIDFLHFVQQFFRRNQIRFPLSRSYIFITQDTVSIDDEIGTDGIETISTEYAVIFHHFVSCRDVAAAIQQRIINL